MTPIENYSKRINIPVTYANIAALLLLVIAIILFGVPFYFMWNPSLDIHGLIFRSFPLLIFGIIAHELIHGLLFALYAEKGLKSVRFGIVWKMLTPYCHCKEAVKVKFYIIVALFPAIILGLIPIVISFFNGSIYWLFFGVFNISISAGDLIVVWLLRKENPNDYVQYLSTGNGHYIFKKPPSQI
jgi:hypothetical protein